MRSTLPSLAFYGVDLAAGWMTGCLCPSCRTSSNPVRSKKHIIDAIRECRTCRLLYRPTAISKGRLARFYYSHFYTNAGIATDTSIPASRDGLREVVLREGKDRCGLVGAALRQHHVQPDAICVFGCSWGYELLALQSLGLPLFGIELSEPRRRLAIERFGLSVYPDISSARGRFVQPLVLSSHVLEHVPEVERILEELASTLRPRLQIHVTPAAMDGQQVRSRSVGREHVLGLTGGFWRRYAATHALDLTLDEGGGASGAESDELVAILAQQA